MSKYRQQKERLFSMYGTHCVCCGESDKEFLTFDHKNGTGKAHRAKFRKEDHKATTNPAYAIYRDLLENFNENIQILCFNCNYAKKHFPQCPHEKRLDILSGTVV